VKECEEVTAPDWKRSFRREVADRLCRLERYRTDVQSRRLEGQLGGYKESLGFAAMAYLLELSPHLDSEKAGAFVAELNSLRRTKGCPPCTLRPYCFPGGKGEVRALPAYKLTHLGVSKLWPHHVLEKFQPEAGTPTPVLEKPSLPGGYRPGKDDFVVFFVDRDFGAADFGAALEEWKKRLRGRFLIARCDARDSALSWSWLE
jgi:hypothetical protein